MRGDLRYEGPLPCSRRGHIEGSAIIMAYRARSLPQPRGIANRPVNFTVVSGDTLFPNVPRYSGPQLSCPSRTQSTVASAPFAISPLDAGSYVLIAFYSRSGNLLPSFAIRNQMEQGDIYGGAIDNDAERANPNLAGFPTLLSVDVGEPTSVLRESDGALPLAIPPQGFLVEGLSVTLLRTAQFGRPYFYIDGGGSETAPLPTASDADADADYPAQIVMTQDHQVKAPPKLPSPASLKLYADSFVGTRLSAGVRSEEFSAAVDPREPLLFRLNRATPETFSVFARGQTLPESDTFAALWPKVTFTKLLAGKPGLRDPQRLFTQTAPTVFLSGITLADDSFSSTLADSAGSGAATPKDHIRVLVRPAALCIRKGAATGTGLLVTPHRTGIASDATGGATSPLFEDTRLLESTLGLARTIRVACLPLGRYAVTTTYPTGQSWTLPNESGSCAALEGQARGTTNPTRCGLKDRPVLRSQGPSAVLEIVAPTTAEGRAFCEGPGRVPDECQ
jgi:hypothetical protein